mmetsp:Transcript_37375/g.92958  ORF Transcript_37375/g.92958 Transcript_37375/m.92958 type:complete len:217 (+) Transcript_37375:592-1242(+)
MEVHLHSSLPQISRREPNDPHSHSWRPGSTSALAATTPKCEVRLTSVGCAVGEAADRPKRNHASPRQLRPPESHGRETAGRPPHAGGCHAVCVVGLGRQRRDAVRPHASGAHTAAGRVAQCGGSAGQGQPDAALIRPTLHLQHRRLLLTSGPRARRGCPASGLQSASAPPRQLRRVGTVLRRDGIPLLLLRCGARRSCRHWLVIRGGKARGASAAR